MKTTKIIVDGKEIEAVVKVDDDFIDYPLPDEFDFVKKNNVSLENTMEIKIVSEDNNE